MSGRADYSLGIKREMLAALSQLPCCRQSFLAGLLDGHPSRPFVRCRRALIKRLKRLFKKTLGAEQEILLSGARLTLANVALPELRMKFVERFYRLATAETSSKHCQIAFAQGLFVAHGYIQNPGRGYHLEFRLKSRWQIAAFKRVMRLLKIRFSSFVKADHAVFYSKSSRRIIKFLHQLGVFNKALELSDFTATRKILSMVNRQVNSETANINRLVGAAERSIIQIQQLIELPEQEFWTENLYETALMRLKFPHDSIEKLGSRFSPTLTKSAVNHRLRRINAIHKKLLGQTRSEDEIDE